MDSGCELLSFVARSANRIEVLRALAAEPATRSALQVDTGIPRATLSRILVDFQDRDLAVRYGYEFTITPLGRFLSGELQSLFGSIEAIRQLQTFDPWLPLSELHFDIRDLTDARITLPTPVDPLAPVRRTAEVLAASERVRGLCNNVVPALLETLSVAVIEGGLRVEVVVSADAFDAVSADPSVSEVVHDLVDSGRVDLGVCAWAIPQLAIDADGTILLEVTDDEGAIRGLIESENDAVRSWFETAYDIHRHEADRIAPEVLA